MLHVVLIEINQMRKDISNIFQSLQYIRLATHSKYIWLETHSKYIWLATHSTVNSNTEAALGRVPSVPVNPWISRTYFKKSLKLEIEYDSRIVLNSRIGISNVNPAIQQHMFNKDFYMRAAADDSSSRHIFVCLHCPLCSKSQFF